jgi:hypothetical protein
MIENQFMPHLHDNERLQALEEASYTIDEGPYYVPLTPEGIALRKDIVVETNNQLADLESQKKDAIKEFKEAMKPIAELLENTLTEINTKQEERRGKRFSIADFESGDMNIYDATGTLIESRRLRPTEKQGLIQPLFIPGGFKAKAANDR